METKICGDEKTKPRFPACKFVRFGANCGMSSPALLIDSRDTLAVALRDLPAGEKVKVAGRDVLLVEPIAAKHKFTLDPMQPGDTALMYGVTVGRALRPIPAGGLISTENLAHQSDDYSTGGRHALSWTAPDVSAWKDRTFQGYHRSDGSVGTANHWLVVPLVFCENRNIMFLKEALEKALGYGKTGPYEAFARKLAGAVRSGQGLESVTFDETATGVAEDRLFPGVDGIKFLTHSLGCGGTRDDARALCGLIAGYITHPNVAGATVLSLGCQNAQVDLLKEEIQLRRPGFDKPLLIFEQQGWPSERAMLEAAMRDTVGGLAEANRLRREPAPLSKLVFGMECGGSDGFSGISANPAVGQAADLLVALGGSVILSEFPELCGVEQELVNRCLSDEDAVRFADLMRVYNARAEAVGAGFHMNPSPGNIRDGLITDAIKSAGAAKKGGTSPVVEVLDYPELVTRPGLTLLCTPGGDVESTTAMAAAHANVMFFTTGLGTPTGNPVCPVVKVATNSTLATRMPDIIDYDAGPIITGDRSVAQSGADLLNLAIEIASGNHQTKAQILGQDDFQPWKRGVSL
ncbi:MAG: UxaA family hydrolase [Verrucomicrobiales bacterium]